MDNLLPIVYYFVYSSLLDKYELQLNFKTLH